MKRLLDVFCGRYDRGDDSRGNRFAGAFIVPMISNLRRNSVLRQTDEPARAKILKIWKTGVTVNDDSQVDFLPEVRAADRPPFQAETKSVVSRLQTPLVQIGSTVEVRFDRQNFSKIALAV